MTRAKAHLLRSLIEKAAASLSDEDALEGMELFQVWAPGVAYLVTERVRYEGQLYRCEQAHTSQEIYPPDITPALWTPVAEPWEEWPEWRQPTGAQDYYIYGAKVSHNGKHWISKLDVNTYEPGVYGWDEAEEESNE